MSIQAVAWALDQDLPARPKLVLVSIANHANHTDGYCWLRADTIAAEAACKPRSVFRFVGDLIRNGYIRKESKRSDDGRQRANDYWILLDRAPAAWIAVGSAEELSEDEQGDDENVSQDVVSQTVSLSCGEDATPCDSGVSLEPVEKHALSCGPTDSGVSHIDSAEPSKTKPKEGARPSAYRPRAYAPPPPPKLQPVAEVITKNEIFVYVGTPAYDAWCAVMAKQHRVSHWRLHITKIIDGKARQGWYFASLYPPSTADPPKESAA